MNPPQAAPLAGDMPGGAAAVAGRRLLAGFA
jgi:hypothetical protein